MRRFSFTNMFLVSLSTCIRRKYHLSTSIVLYVIRTYFLYYCQNKILLEEIIIRILNFKWFTTRVHRPELFLCCRSYEFAPEEQIFSTRNHKLVIKFYNRVSQFPVELEYSVQTSTEFMDIVYSVIVTLPMLIVYINNNGKGIILPH